MIWGVGHSSSSVRFREGQAFLSHPRTEGIKSKRRMSECGLMHGRSEMLRVVFFFSFFFLTMLWLIRVRSRDVAVRTDNNEPFPLCTIA